MGSGGQFASNAGGGDWAAACEVFRKYDADGSGRLDRAELLAALHDLNLLSSCSATAAGRALADMDTNGDGVVSFEEFREAYSRLSKLRAAEQRSARLAQGRKAAPPVPPNAAVDPRLRAAFMHFASAARAITAERTPRGGADSIGLKSGQFHRLCVAAQLPVESGVLDVIFATLCAGRGRTLSFQRFLEALAQVAHEGSMPLETVLDAVRAIAPAGAPAAPPAAGASAAGSPAKSPRPKSPACVSPRPGSAAHARKPSPLPPPLAELAAYGAPSVARAPTAVPAPPLSSKLQQRVVTLQQLLEEGPEGEEEAGIPAHPGQGPDPDHGPAAEQVQQGTAGHLLLNPAFQGQEGADLAPFRLDLLSLLDQRCEAAEAACAALVATRAELTKAAMAQCSATLSSAATGSSAGADAAQALAAVAGLEASLSELDGRLSAAVRQVGQECRAAVSVVGAQVEALQKAHDQALRQTNEAILCIARRVGALAGQGQQGQAS
ncbi:hypothetical protein ABPG75_013071 [Micractinium tetrahymenae]